MLIDGGVCIGVDVVKVFVFGVKVVGVGCFFLYVNGIYG